MKCVNCGEEIGVARVCWKCLTRQPEGGGKTNARDTNGATASEESEQRRFCRSCGAELNENGVCPACGTTRDDSPSKSEPKAAPKVVDERTKRRRVILASLGTAAALMCAIVGVVWYGIYTAVHWEKVDNPGVMMTKQTGYYNVSMTDEQVCYVGQDWTDCINALIAEYNRECTKPMPPEGANTFGSSGSADAGNTFQYAAFRHPGINQRLCERYSEMISDMQAKDGPGYYVASLGDWWKALRSSVATERVLVGYKSHEAVCYYGFLGECPNEDEDK